ncbi:hypothetical protein PIB30_057019 [Stylosanthes scabra]|nr:hypothetical protein [Stylosanthes scabra]
MYDVGMRMIFFVPIALLSWFPFTSTFQSRLLFHQAFNRGLEISLILTGNKAYVRLNTLNSYFIACEPLLRISYFSVYYFAVKYGLGSTFSVRM